MRDWIFRERPMFWPRFMGWGLLVAVLLGEFRVLGFRPAPEPQSFVALIGGVILVSICKAHDSLKARGEQ